MAFSLQSAFSSTRSVAPAARRLPSPLYRPFRTTAVAVGRSSAHPVTCNASTMINGATNGERRSANFQPSIWDHNFLQSLVSHDHYDEKQSMDEVERMKEYVKGLILSAAEADDPLRCLELIDAVQRLGLQYHFDVEIKQMLAIISDDPNDTWYSDDLYATALRFRLLRQHCYDVSQDAFKRFVNSSSGTFNESFDEDVKCLLSLYEASFLARGDEAILDEAMAYSTRQLMDLRKKNLPLRLANEVDHALDMPIHWRPNRLEARWFIDVYEEEPDMNPTLLRLAKLDFNIVQSVYREDIAELTRWWDGLGLAKMTFFRDRLVENYMWTVFMMFEPQYGASRVLTAKLACMVTTIDDVYDVYGTVEELELLTDFIDRWDITEIDKLPPAIRKCFLALYNTTNEIGLWLMMERDLNLLPYLQKMWVNECKSYMVELSWNQKGMKPTLKEYLINGVDSIGGLILLVCSFLVTAQRLSKQTLEHVTSIPPIMHCSNLILRLNNDIATSPYELARGDNVKAMECYMSETGASEEAAREHMKGLVRETWKTMNEVAKPNDYPSTGVLVDACLNLARASQCFYQYGDGHGIPGHKTKEHVLSILIQPVPM